MRRIRKVVFKRHFDQLQREDDRRVPDHKHRVNDSAQGLGIVPRKVEDDVERPRGNAELEQGGGFSQPREQSNFWPHQLARNELHFG